MDLDEVKEKVKDIAQDVGDKIHEVKEKAADVIEEKGEQIGDNISQKAEEKYDKSKQKNGYSEVDKNQRDTAEVNSYQVKKKSKNFADWLRGGATQSPCTETIKVKKNIDEVQAKLDEILKEYDSSVVGEMNSFYRNLKANTGKWEGETQEKALEIAGLFKVYLDDIRYFYESLEVHLGVLEQDADNFYSNSSQVKNLESLIL